METLERIAISVFLMPITCNDVKYRAKEKWEIMKILQMLYVLCKRVRLEMNLFDDIF